MNLKNGKNLIKTAALGGALIIICIIVFFAVRGSQQQQRTLLTQFVLSGGVIVWFIQLPLSVITIGLIIDYCLNIKTSALLPPNFGTDIIKDIRVNGWQRLDKILAGKGDLVSVAVLAAVRNKSIDRRQWKCSFKCKMP
jgi:hypothetical protein